jgi:hypothetical protein
MKISTSVWAMIAMTDDPPWQLAVARQYAVRKLIKRLSALVGRHSYEHKNDLQ